jgi:4-hydroxythreonine-4-phosphate dehydrogenase
VTAPINKEALHLAGIPFPGHTEMLASLAGVEHVTMMLYNPELRVVLVSVHVSLREAVDSLSVESELRAIRAAASIGPAFGLEKPRIGVAGLNPHAGEGGMFGDEEARIIAPAIEQARTEGFDVSGPWPGDTVFMHARAGEFDVVVAQYHDQGLIPVKYLGLDTGVNVTLGLPFVRTSVDHGTAFAIAGKGIASAESLITAIDAADRFSRAR